MTLNPKERDISCSARRYCQIFFIITFLVFISSCTKEEVVEKAEPVKPVKTVVVEAGGASSSAPPSPVFHCTCGHTGIPYVLVSNSGTPPV